MTMVLVSVMGELAGQSTENVIVSPSAAAATTDGKDPGPEPLQLVTESVAAPASSGKIVVNTAPTPTTATEATSTFATDRQPRERRRRTSPPNA